MALDQSVLSELLAAFQSGEGLDLIRESVRLVCQELIETEVSALIGAGRYERSDERTNERNGHRARTLTTKAGDVELAIPKLRRGSFFPSILEPRRRIDQALYAVVMEAYVHGVSTRSVDELVEAMGSSAGISKSEVSRICAGLDEAVGAFRGRPARPRPLPLHLARRHLPARTLRASGDLQSRGRRHRGHRRRTPGNSGHRDRRLRRGLLA
jgi:transposase-like protein